MYHFLTGAFIADRRPFGDIFFPATMRGNRCFPRMRLTYYRASTLTVEDMVRERKKNSGVFGHWDFGVVTPPWSCISWLLLTFISNAQYDLTPTHLSELFPHLFFPFPFCSATLAVLEYISFISNLGSLHCSKMLYGYIFTCCFYFIQIFAQLSPSYRGCPWLCV